MADIDGYDIAESVAEGGAASIAVYAIAEAVATVPGSFITSPEALVLTTLAGALTFVGRLLGKRAANVAAAAAADAAPAAAK